MVVRADEEVAVRVTASHADMMMTVDGQVGFSVASGDFVRLVARAPSGATCALRTATDFTANCGKDLAKERRMRFRGKAGWTHETGIGTPRFCGLLSTSPWKPRRSCWRCFRKTDLT